MKLTLELDVKGTVKALDRLRAEAPEVVDETARSWLRRVVAGARRRMPSRSAAASIDSAGFTLTAGGPRAPHYGFMDWGGNVGRRGSVKRPFSKRGRAIYPALMATRDETYHELEGAIVRRVKAVGL